MTSLGRRVDVTVSGFKDSPLRFNQLVEAINEIEGMLGIPYPAQAVTMSVGDVVSGGFCGHNQPSCGYRYSAQPYRVESAEIRIRVDAECSHTLASIAHETGHTWFHGNEYANWIDEGLANAVENQFMETRSEIAYPPRTYCESYRNISQLERARPVRVNTGGDEGFTCNYHLGDGIFGELREHYRDQEFNARIAELAKTHENPDDLELTVSDVRRALGDGGKASEIIETWYSGQPEMRKYQHLDVVEWVHPPTTDGEWLHFSGRIHSGGTVHEPITGNDSFCPQFDLFDGTRDTKWVGSINDPISVGYRRHKDTKVFISNHWIDPQTGEFQVTARILDNALWGYGSLSLRVDSRVTTDADGNCHRGVWYSQVPVETGNIASEFKRIEHLHVDAIQWTDPPVLNGNILTFAGIAGPGAVNLEYEDGYCSQVGFYRYDDMGYDWITWVSPYLTDGRKWEDAESEITGYRTMSDGSFEVTARVQGGLLSGHGTILLVVTGKNPLNRATNLCSIPRVMSVAELRK